VSDTDALADDEPAPRRGLPLPVNIASIAGMALGAILVLYAVGYFSAAGDEDFLTENDLTAGGMVGFGAVSLLIAAAEFVTAVLIRRRNQAARIALLVISGLQFLLGFLALLLPLLVVAGAVFVLLLFPASTKAFFARPAAADA
jgi:hypothetical protein